MEFNRLISLVLGFIVLILVFVWIGSRFRSATRTTTEARVTVTMTPTPTKVQGQKGWNPFGFLFKGTPTPTKSIAKRITPTVTSIVVAGQATQETDTIVYKNNRTGETQTIEGVQRIPETGAPTLVIPFALSALTFGAYLRKRI
jgi:hypothetical protein